MLVREETVRLRDTSARNRRVRGRRARHHRQDELPDGRRRELRHRRRFSGKPVYKRRRRAAMLVMAILFLIPLLPALSSGLSGGRVAVAKVEPPVFSTAPQIIDGNENPYTPPEDPSLSLTVPKLGVYGHTVRDDASAEALDAGAIKIPETGFPWERSANTYIAGHRVGYRDTESYYQFMDLPSMKKGDEVILEDGDGQTYVYAVTEVFAVEPHETWVTEPVAGKDLVTLQTCTESVDDWQTIGPEVMVSGPDTGRLVVRAERV